MKKAKFTQSVLLVALITQLLLLVPLLGMVFTNEVNWSPGDFIMMAVLLFSAGLAFVLIARSEGSLIYRAAFGLAIAATLLMVWVNLAVGLIGGGPNVGNLMYIGVIAVEIIGAIAVRFRPNRMERVMYFTALALVAVAVIALISNMQQYSGSSVTEIIGVNGFFAALFAGSGMLFRRVTPQQLPGSTS